jgi:small neutral amino acid transporter SnatA (MarC family)
METEMLSLPEYSSFAFSMFAMLTPFAAIPPFLSLTIGLTSPEKSRTAITAVSTAALVLVVAAVAGEIILTALGTSLESLRVGGGLVLLLTAISMLKPLDELNRHDPDSTAAGAVVPLGVPLLAGPGSISLVIVEMAVRQGRRATFRLQEIFTLWAVERRLRGKAIVADPDPVPDPRAHLNTTGRPGFAYPAMTRVPLHWCPYVIQKIDGRRRFVQGRAADLSGASAVLIPPPESDLLYDPAAGGTHPVHQIEPAAIPQDGLRLERRAMLARAS